jgi:hypothetical protein
MANQFNREEVIASCKRVLEMVRVLRQEWLEEKLQERMKKRKFSLSVIVWRGWCNLWKHYTRDEALAYLKFRVAGQSQYDIIMSLYDKIYIQAQNILNMSLTLSCQNFVNLTTEEFAVIKIAWKGDLDDPTVKSR